MAEMLEDQLYKSDFVLGRRNRGSKVLYRDDLKEETPVHSSELKELCSKISDQWKVTVTNMEENYNAKTSEIDKEWRDSIWNNKWEKYLEYIHSVINKNLNDSSKEPHDIEMKLEFIINYVSSVFDMFVHQVNKDWKRLQKI
ncbi:conserved Plasmodium protein, unknown function [Plasmodium malariae]|uniref:Uncharacterized protein n=2 Tax=Plasmodium (Plasmodium) TaxID=418103 RepID=A0A1A8WSV3_PLAMA|nr:conserved Plasmodium protein, unknown function [Plasmodium malariae]SBS95395.1 conserved Plasmodium protein, unknown function [Plasmodium malariae]SCO94216.1 conserved Plasmodium protein, unknown function [Plasmodium malariae]